MRSFILDRKSFLCGVNAARRAFEFRGWGLEMTQDKDNPIHWFIWNVVDGYWINVIEKVGESILEKDGFHVYIDDDLEDELRWFCMRDAGEILEEGIKNYLENMNDALTKLKEV